MNQKFFLENFYFLRLAVALMFATLFFALILSVPITSHASQTTELELVFNNLQHEILLPSSLNHIPLRILNHAEGEIMNPTIVISMNDEETFIEVQGTVPGFGYLDYSVALMLPHSKVTVDFEVFHPDYEDTDPSNNMLEEDFLLTNLNILGYTITGTQSSLLVEVSIENHSMVQAENVVVAAVNALDYMVVYDNLFIPVILPNETKVASLYLDEFDIAFEEEEFLFHLIALVNDSTIQTLANEDYAPQNNLLHAMLSESAFTNESHLEIRQSPLTLKVGQSAIIHFSHIGFFPIQIVAQDASVAQVDGRNVYALKVGETQIELSDGTQSELITLTVEENAYSLQLVGEASFSLLVNDTYTELFAESFYHQTPTAVGYLRLFGFVGTSAAGTYKITYHYVVNNAVVVSAFRTVVVRPNSPVGVARFGKISGYALANSIVILYDSVGLEVERYITSDGGYYIFQNLENGTYSVVAMSNGVESSSISFDITDADASTRMLSSPLLLVLSALLALTALFVPTLLILLRRKKNKLTT